MKMNSAAASEVHEPRNCAECKVKLAKFAEEEFIRKKFATTSEKLIEETLEMHMLQLQDPMWLFAEALRGLPPLSSSKYTVYKKLFQPLYDTYPDKYVGHTTTCDKD